MTPKRTYGDACGAAHALDLVGERWALLVARELMLGPKRFTDLRTGIPGASPNVLAQRLRELEETGVVRRRRLPPPAASAVYELTEWGQELEPVIQALGRFGARSPFRAEDGDLSVDAMMASLATMFDAEEAGDLDATYELRIGGDVLTARVSAGELAIRRGAPDAPAAVIEGHQGELAAAVYQGGRDLTIEGDREAAERFLCLFNLPEVVSVPDPVA